jgi:hypothetical protein
VWEQSNVLASSRNRKLQIHLYNLAVQSGVLDWPWLNDLGGRPFGWDSWFMQ